MLLKLKHKARTLSEGTDEAWGGCAKITIKLSCAACVSLENANPESLGVA